MYALLIREVNFSNPLICLKIIQSITGQRNSITYIVSLRTPFLRQVINKSFFVLREGILKRQTNQLTVGLVVLLLEGFTHD
tara:strand:- start:803 stop:1045 length:243 start_codon:yes stop_codon:yes gene_type:complete